MGVYRVEYLLEMSKFDRWRLPLNVVSKSIERTIWFDTANYEHPRTSKLPKKPYRQEQRFM